MIKGFKKYMVDEKGEGNCLIYCEDCIGMTEEERKNFGSDTDEDYVLELEDEEYSYNLICEHCLRKIVK
jgi:hypothetical protein